ncbi:hypothetical protein HPB48_004757 [Haemaphysalis longicornis]|uniref:DM domain-containing protein n=1 Tax=Haemaphysalis longicornis TaxID=44386 RepID=A0A9J6FZU0_HAELO|nr:hypothetical protein HPB48_004757 [Haemaphysalis longicornis]
MSAPPGVAVTVKTCARCRNHGLRVVLKSHKRHCPYRHCTCSYCDLITMRRQILAQEASIQKKEEAQSSLLAAGLLYEHDELGKRPAYAPSFGRSASGELSGGKG